MSQREFQPKIRGWSEGVLKEELRSVGGTVHLKGSIVRCKRYKEIDEEGCWTGKYEWHYLDQTNYNLIRARDLLI